MRTCHSECTRTRGRREKYQAKGKGKIKYQAHVAEEEESLPSKKALVEIEDYVL
jgi:hypothetical protein